MINANELRCGNKVFDQKTGDIQAITGVWNDRVKYGWQSVWNTTVNDIDGVPLTSELLEKAGFDYDGDKHAPTWFNSIIGYIGKCEGGYTLPDSDGEPSISYVLKYVHQLQNLYFALTGEDLKIEL